MDRSKSFTLFTFPDRPVHSDINSASPGSILAKQQLLAKTKSLTFPPLSIARYSFIQLSEQGRQWREQKCPIFETVAKGDLNPGSLDCKSGILPLSYCAQQKIVCFIYFRNEIIISHTLHQYNRVYLIPPGYGFCFFFIGLRQMLIITLYYHNIKSSEWYLLS